jgi:hypothetical protein
MLTPSIAAACLTVSRTSSLRWALEGTGAKPTQPYSTMQAAGPVNAVRASFAATHQMTPRRSLLD